MKIPSNGFVTSSGEGEKKFINSELWHACAGPLVSLPPAGSLVVYFPQGHSEQVAASMHKKIDDIPSYPNLPSKLICMLHNVTLHADTETDEVYAQMTLQPVSKYDQEALLVSDIGLKQCRQPSEFFCKTLTASDTSTHGGFSVPRRAAEKIFPPLDFTMQPPAQEISARDLHDQPWIFRHIYRGQPKRHLLTTGWSIFVSSKRLVAGDAVLFIRDEKSQLQLGIRRASRQQPPLSSSVISSDSMHIGILAAAAHAASNSSPFTIFYNPRASPSEFVIPLAKYNKAMYTQVSLGMRFRMMFETEESGVRRYVGTVTGTNDLDPVRWKGSQWRNVQVGWDESSAGERPSRVSIWEVEPVVTPFYICPPPFFRPKFPKQPGFAGEDSDMESIFKRGMPWIGTDDFGLKDSPSSIFPGLSLDQWMSMQQQQNNQSAFYQNISDDHSKLLNFQSPKPDLHLSKPNLQPQQQLNQLQQSTSWPQQQQMLNQFSTTQQRQPLLHQTQQPAQHQRQRAPQQNQQHQQQQQSSVQNVQQAVMQAQIQQQQILARNNPPAQQNNLCTNKTTFPVASMPQDIVSHQHVEHQRAQHHGLQSPLQSLQKNSKERSEGQRNLSEQQLQLQFLQKLQQQQLQLLSNPLSPALETQRQDAHRNQHSQNINTSFFSATTSPQTPLSQFQAQQKNPIIPGSRTMVNTDVNGPSFSNSPSKNSLHVSQQNFLGTTLMNSTTVVHNLQQDRNDLGMKHDITNITAEKQQAKYKGGSSTDHLDASSSATSFSLDASGGVPQNFQLIGLENDVQSHNTRGSAPFIDGLAPDALLSSNYDVGKDIQNMMSNYSGNPRDMETDMSSGINSQSFGMPMTMPFKPGCSNDAPVNDASVLSSGLWPNQTPRMRTYTKVQKRGSVGRTIDVTRYKAYDELRNDLARMFGIEGLLEDPQRTEWKLVYVDHENDILLVGDDPWEEFVSCVQSIKILSSAEVQQMSLDGDLGQMPVVNQACSGTDSGNAWRQYDDNSATSFNQ